MKYAAKYLEYPLAGFCLMYTGAWLWLIYLKLQSLPGILAQESWGETWWTKGETKTWGGCQLGRTDITLDRYGANEERLDG